MTQDAAVQAARLATDAAAEAAWGHLHPASVTAYSEVPPVTVTVRPDGATANIPARSLVNRPLQPGARVMLSFAEPGAALVVGIIGNLPPPMGLWQNTTGKTLGADIIGNVAWDTEVANFGGLTLDANNELIQIPYTGVWACTALVEFLDLGIVADELWMRQATIKRTDNNGNLINTIATAPDQWAYPSGFASILTASTTGWYFNASDCVLVQAYDRYGADVPANSATKVSVMWVASLSVDA